jgi:hypothetical protein
VGWPGWAVALLGPGRGPVGLDSSTPFFCSDSFSIFYFSLFFYIFSKLISNKVNPSSKFL